MRMQRLVRALCVVCVLARPSWPLFGGQCCQDLERRILKVVAEESVMGPWRVTGADISEDAVGVETHLEVLNSSGKGTAAGRFYAEYYDARHRRCLTAVFDLRKNREKRAGEMRPGEARTLISVTYELFPASEPTTVRVYRISETPLPLPSGFGRTPSVSRPITIGAISLKATASWYHLCLDQGTSAGAPAVLDLLIALVDVDGAGQAAEISVLSARNPEIQAWFREFAPHLRFLPGTEGGHPQAGKTLLLVRAMMPWMHPGVFPNPPRESDWVRDYTENTDNSDVSVINVVPLDRPLKQATSESQTVNPQVSTAPPLCFDYYGTGTEWSLGTSDGDEPAARGSAISCGPNRRSLAAFLPQSY